MKPRKLVHESLTEEQAFFLGQLMEEAAEVIQRASKCLLYGLKDNHPIVGKPNDEALGYEIGNCYHIVGRLNVLNCIPYFSINSGAIEKEENLMKYHGR
jgi:hypothetical protein